MLDISCLLHCTLDIEEGVYGKIQSGWKYSIYTYKVNNIVEEFVSDIANKYKERIHQKEQLTWAR